MDKELLSRVRGSWVRGSVVTTLAIFAVTMLSAQEPPSPQQPQPQQTPPQAQAQPGQTPTFRSGVELVTIDGGAVDRQGQPMRGLTAGDFTVTFAGLPRLVVNA